MIAAKHYLQVRDAHFDAAAGLAEGAQIPTQQAPADHHTASQGSGEEKEESELFLGFSADCDRARRPEQKPNGPGKIRTSSDFKRNHWPIKTAGINSGNTGTQPPESATKAGPADPDLADVMAAWPALPPALRTGILAMVKAATPTAAPTGPADGG
jgi:hypothetical protein